MQSETNKNILKNMAWKFSERMAAQGVQFVVSIILARLLLPEDFGTIALLTVFIAVSNVFITGGIGTALVQKKDADNIDFSTVFYFSLFLAGIFYILLYFAAPFIGQFYKMDILVPIVRVISLTLIIGAVNTVQNAYAQKTKQFKRFFYSTTIGAVLSAVVGVGMAYMGFGVWALVAQQFTNQIIGSIVIFFTVKWRPILAFSFKRLKSLYSFGWKLLCSGLLDTIFANINPIIIGKLHSAADLGFYNRGNTIPMLIITNINSTIGSVIFPYMTEHQDNKEKLKSMTRRAITVSTFFIFPMMAGLAAVSHSFVLLLLTEKWLPCVAFLQLNCLKLAFWPVHTANLQAINAMGRSDVFLKLEIIKKVMSLSMLCITVPMGIYPMVVGQCILIVPGMLVNTFPNRKLLNYGFFEQMKDIFPSFFISLIMFFAVWSINLIKLNTVVTLIIQVILGCVFYVTLCKITRLETYNYAYGMVKSFVKRGK